jgi:hypothetical protein
VFSVVPSFAQVCSDPGVAEIVDISACFGDVRFPWWVHWAHAGQASLAMEPLADASCHVCGRQLVFTARCAWSILLHPSWARSVHFCIASRCGLLPDCSAQGSLQFAVALGGVQLLC